MKISTTIKQRKTRSCQKGHDIDILPGAARQFIVLIFADVNLTQSASHANSNNKFQNWSRKETIKG